jgi:hypothetical protein
VSQGDDTEPVEEVEEEVFGQGAGSAVRTSYSGSVGTARPASAAQTTTQALSMTYPKSAGAPVSRVGACAPAISPSAPGHSHTCQPSAAPACRRRPSRPSRPAGAGSPAGGRSARPTTEYPQ